ncbi:hypothetical protein VN12_05295 [Pirellula sp. SH-Sr6A]|nr:hypothetical protein VN12_05295 [Pirellula sp. SH-Sr6A]
MEVGRYRSLSDKFLFSWLSTLKDALHDGMQFAANGTVILPYSDEYLRSIPLRKKRCFST